MKKWVNSTRKSTDSFSSSDQTRFFWPFLPAIAHFKMSTTDGGHLAGTPSSRQSGDTGRIQKGRPKAASI
jgi:hypothetical protein